MAKEPFADTDKSHEDHEWEEQRDQFTYYYKTENRTLKDAANLMHTQHRFFATPRQWERRIKAWDLNKYTSRQQRLDQFKAEGRELVDVANPSRRSRKFSASRLLPVKDDRNVRRFAKRELSRSPSRQRIRSTSMGHLSARSSPSPGPEFSSDEAVTDERTYNLDTSVLNRTADHISVPAIRTYRSSDNIHFQAHVLETQTLGTGAQHTEVFLSMPPDQPQFSVEDSFDSFSANDSLPMHMRIDTSANPSNVSSSFYGQSHVDIMDLSPTSREANPAGWPANDINAQNAASSFGSNIGHIPPNMVSDSSPMPILQNDFPQENDFSMQIILEPPADTTSNSLSANPQHEAIDFSQAVPVDFAGHLEDYANNVDQALSLAVIDPNIKIQLIQQLDVYSMYS